jgi:membrane associated rhomboid family serine protease
VIPLRDDVPSRTYPFVNIALIVINVVAFFFELGLGPDLERFVMTAAVIPRLFAGGDGSLGLVDVARIALDPAYSSRVVMGMFLHGGWGHLLGNMLYLWIFGDNVEDRVGHFRYVFFYLICGFAATYFHIALSPRSRIPAIGASGAIAGVLGAYFLLYPRARVVVALPPPLLFFFPLLQVPALVMLGLWFLEQFLFAVASLGVTSPQAGGIAFWAHVGGFAAGMLLVSLFQKRSQRPVARDLWWERV